MFYAYVNPNKSTSLTDFSGLKATCHKIYVPKDINEIAQIIKTANKHKLKVIPIGGGTGTGGGYSGKIDIGIDFQNFSYIHRTSKNTFRVGAGVNVKQLNKYLKAMDLIVPMTEAPNAYIGGSIAIDNPGKPYHGFGLIKHISKITVVLPTGEKICLKSNDKDNLLFYHTIGGEGITGIIVEVEFIPTELKKRENINISFKPNDFDFLESFWSHIISSESESLSIQRGVVFPLGLLQVRAVFEDKNIFNELCEKIDRFIKSYKGVSKFEGQIPIGEMIIDQLAKRLETKFKFFPGISNINYQDKKLNNFLLEYINQEKEIGFIAEIEIGPMKFFENCDFVFNGRIPDFSKIKKIIRPNRNLYLLNYGGSNVDGGTHIAFLSNDLAKIKYHMKKIFGILHHNFPLAKVNEHKASLIRGSQILFMEGKNGLLLRKKLRNNLDPNRVIATTALQNIDTIIDKL